MSGRYLQSGGFMTLIKQRLLCGESLTIFMYAFLVFAPLIKQRLLCG